VNTSLLSQELAPLNAQIEQIRGELELFEDELRFAEAELEGFSAERQQFDALRDICNALDKLNELGAGELFWEEVREAGDASGHVQRLRGRVARFEGEIRGILEKQEALKAKVDQHLDDLDCLYEEVRDAYAREERRKEEFVIEREISPIPYRQLVMPWVNDGETERKFRRSLLAALFWSLVFGSIFPLVNLPIPDRSAVVPEIPERLAMLVRNEPPKPEPVPERRREEKKPEPDQEKSDRPDKPEQPKKSAKPNTRPESEKQKAGSPGSGTETARKKAESTGVLAFKSSFKDLMDETPVAKLGTEARLSKKAPQAAGQARVQRSLVALEGGSGSSGGISNFGVSRNLGNGGGGGPGGNGVADRIGGVGFSRVQSSVAGLAEEARPLSDGPGPGRTDEEIQIVFDRYKAALYRIYNTELRKDPTLRGKMLLRLTIEPGGEVSSCAVESTDLASQELVAQIVARVKRFDFGPKEDVPRTTILYPIDFLPAT
jgi:hypothetical protein